MTKTNGRAVRAAGMMAVIYLGAFANQQLSAQEWRMRQVEPLPPPAVETNSANVETLNPRTVGETSETTDLGPQIVLQPRRAPVLSVYSDTQYLFDSNVALTPNDQTSDEIFFETLGAAYTPKLVDQLTSSIYVRQQFVLYDQQVDLNFYAQTAGLSLAYPIKDWFTMYGGFAASRLFSTSDEHEFYKEFDTQFGLWRAQPLGRGLSLYYGYQFDWLASSGSDLTQSDLSQVENAIYGGVNWQLANQWTAQFLYRFRARDYLQAGRTDVDNLASLAVTYTFNQYVNVRAYVSYGNDDSNRGEFSYDVVNVGGGLNLSARF